MHLLQASLSSFTGRRPRCAINKTAYMRGPLDTAFCTLITLFITDPRIFLYRRLQHHRISLTFARCIISPSRRRGSRPIVYALSECCLSSTVCFLTITAGFSTKRNVIGWAEVSIASEITRYVARKDTGYPK